MTHTIIQKINFRASPARLYSIYMNAKKHGAAIQSRYISIQPRVGGRFSAFTQLSGKFLTLKKNRMIVQTWRAESWKKSDPDSILILQFHKVRGGTRLEMIHTGIPTHDYREILKGWPNYYWNRWRKYLSR